MGLSRVPRKLRQWTNTKDFVPPDVTGLSRREARLVKNRAAAFLSRQRRREEFALMEKCVIFSPFTVNVLNGTVSTGYNSRLEELERENAQLKLLVNSSVVPVMGV